MSRGKVSHYGKGHDLWKDLEFDFRSLVGGKQFLANIELAKNGYVIKSTAHIDGGANIFGAINTATASKLVSLFQTSFLTLPTPIVPTGYNGQAGRAITLALLLSLTIDKRRVNFPFLVTELGGTDVLIGRKFLEHYDLKLDYSQGRNKIHWPEDMAVQQYFDKRLLLCMDKTKKTTVDYQAEADRRDALMEAEDRQAAELSSISIEPEPKRPCPSSPTKGQSQGRGSSFVRDLKDCLAKMEKLLSGGTVKRVSEPQPQKAKKTDPEPYKVDISLISASSMHQFYLSSKSRKSKNRHIKDSTTFVTSVQEIDAELQRRAKEEVGRVEISAMDNDLSLEEEMEAKYQSDEAMVQDKLPSQYREFEALFSRRASDELPAHKPNVDHAISLEKENNLTFEPLRRMTDDQLSETKRYIQDNLHKGFITPSNAPYAAPILFAKKADGSLRLCVDYRKLNELTQKDPYPIPLIDEIMARISRAKIFTKLDIQQAFHRIRMSTESEDYTTFRTRYGTYKYKVLPFGLTNGPATFQRFINDILMEHLDDFCSAYMDDILIYSSTAQEHEIHVKKIMRILQDHGLQADIKKSEFGVKKTKFLGFVIGIDGIEVDPEKISVINNWEYAANVRGVQSYLGFCNFYRRFIKDYSSICRPLTRLTGKDVPFVFDDSCKEAWEALRSALKSAPILRHYDPFKQTRLETDSSDGVVAGVLSQLQEEDGLFHPVGYFSKTMGDAEFNYPIHDKELLAIFRSFKQYRTELLGAQKVVHVYTDHKALEYFMSTKELTARQARWAEFFAEFHFTIMYRTGVTNTLADTLSRRDQELTPTEAKKRAFRTQQMIPDSKIDPKILEEFKEEADSEGPQIRVVEAVQLEEIQEEIVNPVSEEEYDVNGYDVIDQIIAANKSSPVLESLREKARDHGLDYTLDNDKLFFQGRLEIPLEPPELRTNLIRHVHAQPSVAHAGISKTKLLLGRKFHWKNLGNDVAQYIANCSCSRMKARRDKTPGFLHPLPIPARPYQHLTMDFTELPLDEAGYDAALVVMDRLTKKSVSVPCHKTITAKGLAELFLIHWTRHFGMPDSIVSDRGPQFISTFWKEYCRILGTKVKLTTAYNPNVDGQTEVMNQYVKQRLRPFCTYYQDNWSSLLPVMDIAQLTLPHESLGNVTPFQLLNGYEPRTSFDLENPEPPASATEKLNREEALQLATRQKGVLAFAQSSLQSQQDKMKRLADRTRREVDWEVGDQVLVSTQNWKMDRPSRKLSDKWYGPIEVLEKVGESWKVELPDHWTIHPVFHSHSLRKYVDNPLPGQRREAPAPIQLLPEQDEWEIQEILASRLHRNKLQYRIKWTGADEDLEWYPCSDAMYAPHSIASFHHRHPVAKGPPKALPKWLEAYNAGIDDYSNLEDNGAMAQTARTQFFGGRG